MSIPRGLNKVTWPIPLSRCFGRGGSFRPSRSDASIYIAAIKLPAVIARVRVEAIQILRPGRIIELKGHILAHCRRIDFSLRRPRLVGFSRLRNSLIAGITKFVLNACDRVCNPRRLTVIIVNRARIRSAYTLIILNNSQRFSQMDDMFHD